MFSDGSIINPNSPHCSLNISYGTCKENLPNNHEKFELVIISLIPMTILFDLGVMPLGEIRCLSLFGVKLLSKEKTKHPVWQTCRFVWKNFHVGCVLTTEP